MCPIVRKTCAKCGRRLRLSSFYTHPETRDRRRGACKRCMITAALELQRKAKLASAEKP